MEVDHHIVTTVFLGQVYTREFFGPVNGSTRTLRTSPLHECYLLED
jgi:hypothetical protein